MKLLALIADTLREIYARKAIIGIVVIEVLALIVTGLVLFLGMQSTFQEAAESDSLSRGDTVAQAETTDEERTLSADDSLLLGIDDQMLDSADTAGPLRSRESTTLQTSPIDSLRATGTVPGNSFLREMVKGEMSAFAVPITLAFLFFGIFVSAGIIPSMMEKGAIDLLVSKPISRTALLFGRALGGIVAMATNLILFATAVYVLYGMASGVWYAPFILWTFLVPMFTFIVVYSGIVLLNVLTESWVLPMIIAYIHLMILGNFLSAREEILYTFIESGFWRGIIDGLYYILPQTNELLQVLPQVIFTGNITMTGPFVQGTIFAIVTLALAAWRFERKDF